MGPGKAFELFVKRILVNIGFSEVVSDGLYIYDGTPGQMIQGLGEAHNADVLLEPPVQTPFYSKTRLLIECKDYRTKISLNAAAKIAEYSHRFLISIPIKSQLQHCLDLRRKRKSLLLRIEFP